MEIDTDYIVQFPLSIQVSAFSGVSGMTGEIGSAQSSGTVRISWEVQIAAAFQSPDLSVEFEMVNGSLGLDPPMVGNPPSLPSDPPPLPSIGAAGAFLLAAAIGLSTLLVLRVRRWPTHAA